MKNVYDIKFEKALNYIFPINNQENRVWDAVANLKVAVFIHLYYTDTVVSYLKYIEEIPDEIDLFFTVSSVEVENEISQKMNRKNYKVIYKKNRGRDISALLVACRKEILNYDYICFAHDKREKSIELFDDTKQWIRCLWESVLGSQSYIFHIVDIFENNKDIGLLVPPLPLSKKFLYAIWDAWGGNFENVKSLAEKMKLQCDLNEKKEPITIGTVFWARVDALRKLFEIDWQYEDFDEEPLKNDGTISHAIERIFAYVAQDAGYDTGCIMTDIYAAERIEYMQLLLRKYYNIAKEELGIFDINELEIYNKREESLLSFSKKYTTIYIYGAGKYGKYCFTRLKHEHILVQAFLVTEKNNNDNQIYNIPILTLNDIILDEKCGVIIAVKSESQQDIIQNLHKYNMQFNNIYLYNERLKID